MTIRNKDGTLTAKARKKNGRLFTNWISGTGRQHKSNSLELLSPDNNVTLKLTRRALSKDNDVYYVSRTDEMPDRSGKTIFFCLLRYTERNITEVGFSTAGGGIDVITISKWQEMDGGLRFTPGKQPIDADELLIEVGRALYRMSPDSLLDAVGRADDIRHWTSTFSPTQLVEKIRGESSEELRCARTYKLIVSLFFLNDTDRTRADHFFRLVAKSMTNGEVECADICDKFLSHYPLELKETLRLASEMVKSDASLTLAVTPAIPPQGTNAPLVATRELLAEKFLEAEAQAKAKQEHLAQLKPPTQESPEKSVPLDVVLPPAFAFLDKTFSRGPARLIPARIPSRMDIINLVGRKTLPAAPRPSVTAITVVAPVAPKPSVTPARPLSYIRMPSERQRVSCLTAPTANTQPEPKLVRSKI